MAQSERDLAVASMAADADGVFTDAQAAAFGVTPAMVRTRVARGQWLRVGPGVLAVAGAPPTFQARCRAAALALPGSAVAGRAAAELHGLGSFEPSQPELVVPPGAKRRSALGVVRQRRQFRRTRLRGIPIGTIDQTLVDLAALVPTPVLARTVDDALVDRRVHLAHLEDRLVECSADRARGTQALRAVVEARSDGTAPSESELERHLHLLLTHPDLPPSDLQPALPWRATAAGRVDAIIWQWRLIVEADGRRWHARWRDFEIDRRRDAEALAAGFRTLRLTWAMLTIDRDATVDLLLRIGREDVIHPGRI